MPCPSTTHYAALILSPLPHAEIQKINKEEALKVSGVVGVFTAEDIEGINDISPTSHGEPLFAEKEVLCVGFPIGVVVAKTEDAAKEGAKRVENSISLKPLPHVLTVKEAIEKKNFMDYQRKLESGDVEGAFSTSDHIIEGEMDVGGQDHFYLEPHAALCIPGEDGEMIIYASTQSPSETQHTASEVLGVPANRIACRVKRLGGGFGGKETRTSIIVCAAAIGAKKLNLPVKLIYDRHTDMAITGGRHPFHIKYKVGFQNDGKVKALDINLYCNAGCTLDLSGGVLERAMTHADNTYKIPNARISGHLCQTNLPSNTAFRGFGAPQSMIVCETWIERIAQTLHLPSNRIRELNFYKEGEVTPYGQKLKDVHIQHLWSELMEKANFEERNAQVSKFNTCHRWKKRGIAALAVKYGMSFTAKHLNQAVALVHLLQDGSVLLHHGGIEMGQVRFEKEKFN